MDAQVNDYFSKFDWEDSNDSASSADTKEVETKEEVKVEDTDTDSNDTTDSSENSDTSSDDSKEENTPFHEHPRWKELIKERKELRSSKQDSANKIFDMEKRIKELESKPLSDDDYADMTPTEIKESFRKQWESENELNSMVSKREQEDTDRYIDDTLQDLRDAGFKFDENEVLKISVEFTNWDIEKAFELHQKFWTSNQKAVDAQVKKEKRLKQSESNTSNRTSWESSWGYERWMSWSDIRGNMK